MKQTLRMKTLMMKQNHDETQFDINDEKNFKKYFNNNNNNYNKPKSVC